MTEEQESWKEKVKEEYPIRRVKSQKIIFSGPSYKMAAAHVLVGPKIENVFRGLSCKFKRKNIFILFSNVNHKDKHVSNFIRDISRCAGTFTKNWLKCKSTSEHLEVIIMFI